MPKRYTNYMEQVVEKALREFLHNDRTICKCEQCYADMAASALNMLKPVYITSNEGLTHAGRRERDVGFASGVIHAVKAASELVRKSPRHDAALAAAEKTPPPAVSGKGTSKSGTRPKTTVKSWGKPS